MSQQKVKNILVQHCDRYQYLEENIEQNKGLELNIKILLVLGWGREEKQVDCGLVPCSLLFFLFSFFLSF